MILESKKLLILHLEGDHAMNTSNLNTLIQRYEDNFEWIKN